MHDINIIADMKKILAIVLLINAITFAFAQNKCGIEIKSLTTETKQDSEVRMLAKVTSDFDARKIERQGIKVGSRIGDIITLRLTPSKIAVLEREPSIVQYTIARDLAPLCNRVREETRVDSVYSGIDLPQGFDGTDVIIGITDWGFDYTHPNFNNNGTDNHRLLRAWDHYKLSGPHPEGFDYGTEFIGYDALIAAEGDTSGLYGYGTHGNHVAGIAAGRGIDGNYMGQAPNADLLFASFGLDEAAWLDAVAWMHRVALDEGKRLVVNCSWGMYTFSTLDGTSLLSQAINAYAAQDVVIVTSGGNNGNSDFHVQKTFGEAGGVDGADTLRTIAEYYSNGVGQALIVWGEPDMDFMAGFGIERDGVITRSPLFNTADGDVYMDSILVVGSDTVEYNVLVEHANILNNRPHVLLNVGKTDGLLTLFVYGEEGTVDAWNVCNLENHAGNIGCAFSHNMRGNYMRGNDSHGIGEPACAEKAITVAAHKFGYTTAAGVVHYGTICDFSSHGPAYGGGQKPEISAPGSLISSSISSFTTESYAADFSYNYEGKRYIWAKMSGTSMSCPAVTGIVALMLQACPMLPTDSVRAILFRTAENDDQTGELIANDSMSVRWGHGKIHAWRAVNEALAHAGVEESQELRHLQVYPNPASESIMVFSGSYAPQTLRIYDMTGRVVLSMNVILEQRVDISHLAPGVYVAQINGETSKIVKQ